MPGQDSPASRSKQLMDSFLSTVTFCAPAVRSRCVLSSQGQFLPGAAISCLDDFFLPQRSQRYSASNYVCLSVCRNYQDLKLCFNTTLKCTEWGSPELCGDPVYLRCFVSLKAVPDCWQSFPVSAGLLVD